jgi:CheY-like chemotaxis protein
MNASLNSAVRIVIAEDDAVVAADIEDIVTALGHVVVAKAESGTETVRLVDQFSPDLAVVDIALPGAMDGIEVANQIRLRSPFLWYS